LSGFYQTLARLENNPRSVGHVTILQIGDSHTAGDHISGRLRELFQERFGNAGRGMLAPGDPYRFYRPYQVKVTQTRGWLVVSSVKPDADGPFGLAGYNLRGRRAADKITLAVKDEAPAFDVVEIEYLKRPKSGTIVVAVDGRVVQRIRTAAARPGFDRAIIRLRKPGREVEVWPAGDGLIEMLSWSITNNKPGIVYLAHGFGGTTINIVDRWDPEIVNWQLRHLKPAMIVVAFGTNEGFAPSFDPEKYIQDFNARMALLRQGAPAAAIVVVGPPDASRLPGYCFKKREELDGFNCAALSKDEIVNYAGLLREQDRSLCRFHAPPALAMVRDVQRAISARNGYLFYDWQQLMNGECGTDKWARLDPPLAHFDRIHMRIEGYAMTGEDLFKLILARYRRR